MPTWQWSYPYNGADSATVLFDASPADSSYRWDADYDDLPQPAQALVRTLDRTMYGYKLGEEQRVFTLRFGALPAGNADTPTALYGYLGIRAFLVTHVDFSIAQFRFYDHVGTAEIPVRFLDWALPLVSGGGGVRAGQVRLIEVV